MLNLIMETLFSFQRDFCLAVEFVYNDYASIYRSLNMIFGYKPVLVYENPFSCTLGLLHDTQATINVIIVNVYIWMFIIPTLSFKYTSSKANTSTVIFSFPPKHQHYP